MLLAAEILEDLAAANISTRVFDTGLGISIFRDKSTRTRYAFRSGCNLLGLMTEELDESTSQIAHGETVRETAAMISFLTEVIGIRDDMFLGEGHKYMTQVSDALCESSQQGVLLQRPAVVNLQCDLDHPTQSLADLRHLAATFGGLEALKGKKLAMTWAYSPSYGKPLSVPQGIVALMTRFGMNVVLAHPEGYDLVEEPLQAARRFAAGSGGSFSVVGSMEDAFKDADIVYPKSWAPARVMHERTQTPARGRVGQAGRSRARGPGEQRALQELGVHRRPDDAHEGRAGALHALPAGRRNGRELQGGRGERVGVRALPAADVPRGRPQAVRHRRDDPGDAVCGSRGGSARLPRTQSPETVGPAFGWRPGWRLAAGDGVRMVSCP